MVATFFRISLFRFNGNFMTFVQSSTFKINFFFVAGATAAVVCSGNRI